MSLAQFVNQTCSTVPINPTYHDKSGRNVDADNIKSITISHYPATKLIVNDHSILDNATIVTGKDSDNKPVRENLKDYILSKLFDYLQSSQNGKIWRENLGITYDVIKIDTTVKEAGRTKARRMNGRSKVEFYQASSDRKESARASNAYTVINTRYGDDVQDWLKFPIEKIVYGASGQLIGNNGTEYKYLFTQLGKLERNPDVLIRRYFPEQKSYPNLGKSVNKVCKITCNTELQKFFNTTEIVIDALLSIGNKGLITLAYGDKVIPVAMLAKQRKTSYQWHDLSKIEISQYLNRVIGLPHKIVGTMSLHTYSGKNSVRKMGIATDKATLSMLYADLSKIFGNDFETFLDNGLFCLKNKTGKIIKLAKLVDNGESNQCVVKPVNCGLVSLETVANILHQNKTYLGRYLTNNTDLSLDKSSETFHKLLSKDYRKVYQSIVKLLKRQCDPMFDYDARLNEMISYHGQNKIKDLIILAKRDLKVGMRESENINNFCSIM